MIHDPDYYIENLMLIQHPEGGYYKETYRSDESILTAEHLKRNVSTGIYYLLKEHEFSAFHRIKSDEMWHFYDGTGILEILRAWPKNRSRTIASNFGSGKPLVCCKN